MFTDPFGLKADTVKVESETLRKVVDVKRASDPVFNALYTALDKSSKTFRLIGTDVAPDDPLNQRSARCTGKTIAPGGSWGGFEAYQSFAKPTDAGVAIIGSNGPHPGETTGHEMGHLIQVKDGQAFSHDDYIMRGVIKHFGY